MSREKLSISSFDTPDFTTRLRRLMPYFLGGLGIALMAGGILYNSIQSKQKTSLAEKSDNREVEAAAAGSVKIIKVDISGAVEQPGVYEIPYDSRVKDVLITAGGLGAKADRNYLAKTVNLAQRVTDGQKIYIPFEGETTTASTTTLSSGVTSATTININVASSSELDTLSGVGPVTAGKIIAGRPYQNISELVSKKIVSNSVYQRIKDKISVN